MALQDDAIAGMKKTGVQRSLAFRAIVREPKKAEPIWSAIFLRVDMGWVIFRLDGSIRGNKKSQGEILYVNASVLLDLSS